MREDRHDETLDIVRNAVSTIFSERECLGGAEEREPPERPRRAHGQDVERPGRVQGRARLALRFTSVTVDGRREEIRSNPVTFQGEQTKGEDATKIGAGAGIGAIVGGIAGGGKGAAIGLIIGGAGGAGSLAVQGSKELKIESGTEMLVHVTR